MLRRPGSMSQACKIITVHLYSGSFSKQAGYDKGIIQCVITFIKASGI